MLVLPSDTTEYKNEGLWNENRFSRVKVFILISHNALYFDKRKNVMKVIFLVNEQKNVYVIYNNINAISYITVVFKSWNIILVSHHIHRTEICQILPSVRRELRNMIGDRAASRPLCQSPVNVIVIPKINMLKTVNHCSPASWENHSIPWKDFLSSGWTRKKSSDQIGESVNVMMMSWLKYHSAGSVFLLKTRPDIRTC